MEEYKRYSGSCVNQFNEFIFKSQFSRKISPMLFMLSTKPLLYMAVAAALYYLGPSNGKFIFPILVILLVRMYMRTRMKYKDTLEEWAEGKDDSSIRILSFVAKKKEYYIKERIKIQRGEEL